MEDNNAKVAKATAWYTISNIMLRGISVFTAPLFTRMLSTSDYGISSNFISWLGIILCVSSLNLVTAVMRGKIEYKDEFKGFMSSVQFLGIGWTLVCSFAFIISMDFWSSLMHVDKICIIAMIFYLVAYPSLNYAQIDFRFEYKYKENVAISVINTLGTVFCSIVLILYWSNQRYIGRVLGTLVPTIILGSYFLIKIAKNGKVLVNVKYWKYALKISLPMVPHGLAMIVLGQIDRVMIMSYCGESQAGIYSFGYSYAVLISVITNAISDAVQPQMYEMLDNGKTKEMEELSYKLITFGILITIILIGFGPEALKILGTKDYFDARWVVFPVAVGTIMQYIYQFFGIIEIYCKKTVYMAIGSCGAAIINFILNSIFLPRYGYIAAAYTTLISYFLLMLFHYYISRILYDENVYNLGKILGLAVLSIMMGFAISKLYNLNEAVRYIVTIIVVLVIALYLRKDIKSIFAQLRGKVGK